MAMMEEQKRNGWAWVIKDALWQERAGLSIFQY
jgi:hypothetical protein